MLSSCKYCGRVHDIKYVCREKEKALQRQAEKRNKAKRDETLQTFRGSKAWHQKRAEIRERDKQVCQACTRGLQGTVRRFETDNLSVHHISPLAEAWEQRLDNNNLITLCSLHHEMAESGEIKKEELLEIVREQEERND